MAKSLRYGPYDDRDLVHFGIVAQLSGLDFGLKALTSNQVLEIGRRSEELGYDLVVLCDHLFLGPDPYPETWTTLTALALTTKTLRIGTHVVCYNFHHPAIVAKMAATLDNLSKGRLHFGIGACGWGQEVEHPSYGFTFLPPLARMRRLREAVMLIRMMHKEDRTSFQGKYYHVKDAYCSPKPLQNPLPIWIGGSGKNLLRVVAELADGWDTGFARLSDYENMLSILSKHCDYFGRNVADLKKSISSYWSIIAEDIDGLEEAKQRYFSAVLANKDRHHIPWIREMDRSEYQERRFALGGTVDQTIQKIGGFIDKGIDTVFLSFADFPSTGMLELFADRVIPEFK